MSIEIEDQCIPKRLELDESTNEVTNKPSKITYKREFLLSVGELDICKELPCGLEPVILCESDDASSSISEWQRTPSCVLLYSSRSSEYVSSRFTRCDSDNNSQESSERWNGRSSWVINRDSPSQTSHDSDSGRHYGDLPRCSWQNHESDGLLGTFAFPRVSGCTAGVTAPRIQENGLYHLNKSDNPYRPPHSYKVMDLEIQDNSTMGKFSPVVNMACDQEKKQSVNHIDCSDRQHETKSVDASVIDETYNMVHLSLAEEVSDNIVGVVEPPYRASNILEACVVQKNELIDSDDFQVTGGMTKGMSGKEHSRLISKEHFCSAFEVESGCSSILNEHHNIEADNSQGPVVHSSKFSHLFLEEKKPASGISSGGMEGRSQVYGGYNGLVTECNSPAFSSDRNKPMCKLMTYTSASAIHGNSEQVADSFRPTVTHGLLASVDFEQTILSGGNEISTTQHHSVQGPRVSEINNEQPYSTDNNGASQCFSSLLQKGAAEHSAAFSELIMRSADKPHYFETERHSSVCSAKGNSAKNHIMEPTFGMDFMDFQSNEAELSVQRCLVDRITRSDISEPCGSSFQVPDDDYFNSILSECGAIGTYHEGITPRNFAWRTEWARIEKNESAFDEVWAEISSLLQMEQELKLAVSDEMVDFECEISLPDEDSLLTFDYAAIPEGSKSLPEIASILPTEQESKLSPVVSCDKISSLLQMEQELKLAVSDEMVDFECEISLPDEDSLLTFDYAAIPEGSKSLPEIASILPTEQESKLSPVVSCDKIADLEAEICLPDEDSLITIDDLIAPQCSKFTSYGNSLKADTLTSNVTVGIAEKLAALNVAHHDERSTVPRLEAPPLIDIMSLGPYHNPHSQQSYLRFQQTRMKLERPSFHSLGPPQVQMSSQIKFVDPNTIHCNPPTHCHSCTNSHPSSWKTPPAKPKGFDHPVRYSVLQQPMNFPQQNQLPRGAVLPDCIKQRACFTQELSSTHFPLLNYQGSRYQGFGVPNPDSGGVGQYIDQVVLNRFIEMDLEAKQMDSFAIASPGQDHKKRIGTGFWFG